MIHFGLGFIISGPDLDSQQAQLQEISNWLAFNSEKKSIEDDKRYLSSRLDDSHMAIYYVVNGDVSDKLDMSIVFAGQGSPATLWLDKEYELSYLQERMAQFMKENGVEKYEVIMPDTKVDTAYLDNYLFKFQDLPK